MHEMVAEQADQFDWPLSNVTIEMRNDLANQIRVARQPRVPCQSIRSTSVLITLSSGARFADP